MGGAGHEIESQVAQPITQSQGSPGGAKGRGDNRRTGRPFLSSVEPDMYLEEYLS